MSVQIDTALVRQYHANVEHLVQQRGSLLRDCVRLETGVVGEQAFYDQIGASNAKKRTTRHGDTPLMNTPHARRRVSLYDYEWADLIDKQDKLKTLQNPESSYAVSAAMALGRSMDDEIITAINATAYTGKTGSTAVALPSAQKVLVASSGLTLAKLLSAKEILDGADVDPDEPRFIAVSPKQVTNLLNTTEIKSADYNTVKALAMGQVDTFLGFKFKVTNRLNVDSSSDRLVLCWVQSGVLLALAQDMETDIGPRRDKSNAIQVYASLGIGATRMEEAKVVQIACSES